MRTRSTRFTALGTVFALALTLAGAVAPAFAAEPATSHHVADLQFTPRPRPQAPAPKPDDGAFFRPDVRVKYLGPDYDNGKYIFRFRVDNIGAASTDVLVDREIHQTSLDGEASTLQYIGAIKIDNLGSDQSTEVRVTCIPKPGYVCMGASADAMVDDDLDPSNNRAHS